MNLTASSALALGTAPALGGSYTAITPHTANTISVTNTTVTIDVLPSTLQVGGAILACVPADWVVASTGISCISAVTTVVINNTSYFQDIDGRPCLRAVVTSSSARAGDAVALTCSPLTTPAGESAAAVAAIGIESAAGDLLYVTETARIPAIQARKLLLNAAANVAHAPRVTGSVAVGGLVVTLTSVAPELLALGSQVLLSLPVATNTSVGININAGAECELTFNGVSVAGTVSTNATALHFTTSIPNSTSTAGPLTLSCTDALLFARTATAATTVSVAALAPVYSASRGRVAARTNTTVAVSARAAAALGATNTTITLAGTRIGDTGAWELRIVPIGAALQPGDVVAVVFPDGYSLTSDILCDVSIEGVPVAVAQPSVNGTRAEFTMLQPVGPTGTLILSCDAVTAPSSLVGTTSIAGSDHVSISVRSSTGGAIGTAAAAMPALRAQQLGDSSEDAAEGFNIKADIPIVFAFNNLVAAVNISGFILEPGARVGFDVPATFLLDSPTLPTACAAGMPLLTPLGVLDPLGIPVPGITTTLSNVSNRTRITFVTADGIVASLFAAPTLTLVCASVRNPRMSMTTRTDSIVWLESPTGGLVAERKNVRLAAIQPALFDPLRTTAVHSNSLAGGVGTLTITMGGSPIPIIAGDQITISMPGTWAFGAGSSPTVCYAIGS